MSVGAVPGPASGPDTVEAPQAPPRPARWNARWGTGRSAPAWTRRLLWVWPAVLTLAACLYGAGGPLLWDDELATWNAASRSPHEIFHLLDHLDAVIGAYYLLIHFWTELVGHSVVALRTPSALAMAGAAAFVTLIGRKLFTPAAGLVAGTLFALVPSVSRYGQEVRGYAFVVFFAALATLLLLRALDRPSALRWVPYALALAGAGLFHIIALVLIVPHALVAAGRWWTGRARGVLVGFPLAALGAVLPLLPLIALGRHQVDRQLSWLAKPTIPYVAQTMWRSLYGSAWVSLLVLACAALPLAWPRGRRPAAETGLVAALPIPLLWFASQGHTSYFLDRYLLFTLPAWAVLAGAGLAALRPRVLVAAGLAAVLVLGAHDQRVVRQRYSHTGWDAAAAAKVIADGYRPGDAVAPQRYGNAVFTAVPVALELYLPERVRLDDVFVAKSAVELGELYPQLCGDPAACLGDVRRVWVVTVVDDRELAPDGTPVVHDDPFEGFDPGQAEALRAAFPKSTVTHRHGVLVTLMER
ncbi:glycosyltransferase family 39 protein [Kitasatospora sp. NPDC090308]|uniref:glycosyltransferase family 39 protein n=1 Tax=Kitasatospora sp. NPDC090308 TaxID=3364082 RepID=UPI003805F684